MSRGEEEIKHVWTSNPWGYRLNYEAISNCKYELSPGKLELKMFCETKSSDVSYITRCSTMGGEIVVNTLCETQGPPATYYGNENYNIQKSMQDVSFDTFLEQNRLHCSHIIP